MATSISTLHRPASSTSTPLSIVQQRRVQAGIVTAIVAVIALALVGVFGAAGLISLAFAAPFPVILLWASSDVLRSDEK